MFHRVSKWWQISFFPFSIIRSVLKQESLLLLFILVRVSDLNKPINLRITLWHITCPTIFVLQMWIIPQINKKKFTIIFSRRVKNGQKKTLKKAGIEGATRPYIENRLSQKWGFWLETVSNLPEHSSNHLLTPRTSTNALANIQITQEISF